MNLHNSAFHYGVRPQVPEDLTVINHPVDEYRGIVYETINNRIFFTVPYMDELLFDQLYKEYGLYRVKVPHGKGYKYVCPHEELVHNVIDSIFSYAEECKKYSVDSQKYTESLHGFNELVKIVVE